MEINKNEVRKDLYKSKNMAKFSHYVSGNLYYNVDLETGRFQFPIPTVEEGITYTVAIDSTGVSNIEDVTTIQLSEDLGQTTFANEIKGSDLNRWIGKAIDNGEFVEISKGGLNITKLNSDIDKLFENITDEEVQAWIDDKRNK